MNISTGFETMKNALLEKENIEKNKKSRMVVYVASKLNDINIVNSIRNMNYMNRLCFLVLKKGHFPYCPAYNNFLLLCDDYGHERILIESRIAELSFRFIPMCDAMLIGTESNNVLKEIEIANIYNIKIFGKVDDIPDAD